MSMAAPTLSPTPGQNQVARQRLLNGPAVIPPAGKIPNFGKPPNLDIFLYVTAALALSFATCAVAIRMYTKHFVLRSIGYEDCKY